MVLTVALGSENLGSVKCLDKKDQASAVEYYAAIVNNNPDF